MRIGKFDYIKMYVDRQADTCRSPIGFTACMIVRYIGNVFLLLRLSDMYIYILCLKMLLTIILFQPILSSPSWYLPVRFQGSNTKARLTWRRLPCSHKFKIVQKPTQNVYSKFTGHHTHSTDSDNFYFSKKGRKTQ